QRRGGHRDKRVGAQHLRVVEPRAVKPELLGAAHQLPGRGVGRQGDGETHGRPPSGSVARMRQSGQTAIFPAEISSYNWQYSIAMSPKPPYMGITESGDSRDGRSQQPI